MKNSGPNKLPFSPKLIPIASNRGMIVPCVRVSPNPASGPIKPTLILLIASSEIGAPSDFSSSIATVIP